MTPEFADEDLDAEVVFDRPLDRHDLGRVQRILTDLAPRWSTKLRLWRAARDQRPIAGSEPTALADAVLAAVAERGTTYRALVTRHGTPPLERVAGTAELRGAGPELVVVISLDQLVLSPLGQRKDLGNAIALQVRRSTVERRPGREWLIDAFTRLVGDLSPVWGYAAHPADYWAKVMSDPPRIEATGRDFGRYLPGLFWLNYFGPRLTAHLGERLALPTARRTGDGTLLTVPDTTAALTRLGAGLFYDRRHPDAATSVPDFSLPGTDSGLA